MTGPVGHSEDRPHLSHPQAERNFERLYNAAMWVVLTWDTEGTQHLTMPKLREALGLPGPRPTREEAHERMEGWMAQLLNRGGD